MAKYQLTATTIILRDDGMNIPPDPANRDYAEYLAWVNAGGVPAPYVEPPEQIAARQRRTAFDADATRADLLTRLRTATPAQINSYVDANVTNLTDARTLFKRILLTLVQV